MRGREEGGVGAWFRSFLPPPPGIGWVEGGRACFGALVGILATSLACRAIMGLSGDLPWLVAPMGASALLLFAAPASPLAQPWPVLGGSVLSTLVGVTCARWIGDPGLAAAVALPAAIVVMLALRCLHPPGGGVALSAVLGGPAIQGEGYQFALSPVGLNALILLAVALAFNNATRRRYPHPVRAERWNIHRTADPPPGDRLGFTPADLDAVLKEYNPFIDVSRFDLDALFRQAELRARHRRFGTVLCADIMSRDVVGVAPSATVPEIWARMRAHRIKAVPVLDPDGRLVGIVTQTDLMEQAGWGAAWIDGHRCAGDLMTRAVRTVAGSTPIVELVSLMSDGGLHHVPVVDEDGRLAGIVTQSDLVVGLYRGRLAERMAA